MIEEIADNGKKTDTMCTWITVVAGALRRGDGRWLMQRRPVGKHHEGLWEFPGGKVEGFELPVQSLARELSEELGILAHADHCAPAGFAEGAGGDGHPGLVILLYIVSGWDGEPQSLEGGEVRWFTPDEVLALDKPPLDVRLAEGLFANIPI